MQFVSQKTPTQTFMLIFAKYWPILKIDIEAKGKLNELKCKKMDAEGT